MYNCRHCYRNRIGRCREATGAPFWKECVTCFAVCWFLKTKCFVAYFHGQEQSHNFNDFFHSNTEWNEMRALWVWPWIVLTEWKPCVLVWYYPGQKQSHNWNQFCHSNCNIDLYIYPILNMSDGWCWMVSSILKRQVLQMYQFFLFVLTGKWKSPFNSVSAALGFFPLGIVAQFHL